MACVNVQAGAQALDACRAGCADIEAAYGVRSSYIRTRFHYFANAAFWEARASGLWTACSRFPAIDSDAFLRASEPVNDIETPTVGVY